MPADSRNGDQRAPRMQARKCGVDVDFAADRAVAANDRRPFECSDLCESAFDRRRDTGLLLGRQRGPALTQLSTHRSALFVVIAALYNLSADRSFANAADARAGVHERLQQLAASSPHPDVLKYAGAILENWRSSSSSRRI